MELQIDKFIKAMQLYVNSFMFRFIEVYNNKKTEYIILLSELKSLLFYENI